ncbi:GNAT family N-acetyltransferase [Cytophagales bacterium LB-30]|uniref:GNAT family N-acetyltransferase n=1 Tax=Shiella aurantiaca TaxID=3058365 RepID=A0ABT8F578_9BACT|nr:GNAT family N-acetyltransferase [Shiella aurantiaca]MDN4165453.1 GNAT family N-acetyltransferase [Shiella aurantiaca]
MEIQQQDDGHKGSFFIKSEGKKLAEMTYVYSGPGRLIIDHTEVDESLRGQKVGNKLLDKVVEMARAKDLKILPLCPFAKATLLKNKEAFADVLV